MLSPEMLTFAFNVFVRSYLPNTGLAAAKIDVRAFSVACIPMRMELKNIKSMKFWYSYI